MSNEGSHISSCCITFIEEFLEISVNVSAKGKYVLIFWVGILLVDTDAGSPPKMSLIPSHPSLMMSDLLNSFSSLFLSKFQHLQSLCGSYRFDGP